jgi:hypothetical protein
VWNDEKTEFLAEIDQTSHVLINGHNDILTLQSKFTFPNLSVRDKCESVFISRADISITNVRWLSETFNRSNDQSINQSLKNQSLLAEKLLFPSRIPTNICSSNSQLT